MQNFLYLFYKLVLQIISQWFLWPTKTSPLIFLGKLEYAAAILSALLHNLENTTYIDQG